jgi:hypothetical protein
VKLRNPVPETTAVEKLEKIINYTEQIMQVKCEDLTYTPNDDGLLHYKAKCLMIGSKLGFVITFTCKSLVRIKCKSYNKIIFSKRVSYQEQNK